MQFVRRDRLNSPFAIFFSVSREFNFRSRVIVPIRSYEKRRRVEACVHHANESDSVARMYTGLKNVLRKFPASKCTRRNERRKSIFASLVIIAYADIPVMFFFYLHHIESMLLACLGARASRCLNDQQNTFIISYDNLVAIVITYRGIRSRL